MEHIGKWLLFAGLLIAGSGAFLLALGKLGIRRFPGDILWEGKGITVYAPFATCLLLSLLFTVLIQWIGRK